MARGQIKLMLLLALFATPMLAAWLAYAYLPPTRASNYGELLKPIPLDLPALADSSGQATPWAAFRGKWVLLVVAPAGCGEPCAKTAYLSRQVRLAQGKEQARIERVILGSLGQAWPELDGAYTGHLPESRQGLVPVGMYLVDPLGNLMMRFPVEPDGKRVIRDLRQLLKASGVG